MELNIKNIIIDGEQQRINLRRDCNGEDGNLTNAGQALLTSLLGAKEVQTDIQETIEFLGFEFKSVSCHGHSWEVFIFEDGTAIETIGDDVSVFDNCTDFFEEIDDSRCNRDYQKFYKEVRERW